ncbi:MAG: hypothetical protein JWR80_9466 [Bradyrhizobium sp.]|nr:hypothetical protein [Bradyrhizobium sp.]
MAEFPALPLWTDAYLGDTTHLTTIEHGAYLLLLMTAWRTSGCCLPDDDRLLARYARMNGQQWKRVRPIIAAFFAIEDGQWRQPRLTDEREAVKRHRQLQSDKGRAGAQAKALKKQGRHKAGANIGLPCEHAEVQPDASSLLHTHIPLDKESNGVVDPEKVLFDQGLALLASHGVPEKRGRPWLGKLRRDYDPADVIRALGRSQREGIIDIIPWVEAALKAKAQTYDPDRITV